MPLVSLTTNSPALENHSADLLAKLSSTVADMLGKSERFVMVKIDQI